MSTMVPQRTNDNGPVKGTSSEHACPFIDELPAHIKSSYARLALIVDNTDLKRIENADDETLIVCCDWLLWQQLSAQGRHAVFYELGILDWQPADTLNTDLFNSANDWLLDHNGDDPTLFHGVSIGRVIGAEMTMALMNFHRFDRALHGLAARFKPATIDFYGFRYDINHLSSAMRCDLVQSFASDQGIAFNDHSIQETEDASNVAVYRHDTAPGTRAILASIYGFTVEIFSRIRLIATPARKRILVLVNSNITEPLARAYDTKNITPVFFARTVPKRIDLVLQCLRRGVLLTNPRRQNLTSNDENRLTEIAAAIRSINGGDTPALRFIYKYIAENLLDDASLSAVAEEILMAEDLLMRERPAEIVVDSVRSRRHLSYLELAKQKGIATNYTWHAPLTPQNLKTGALGGDARQPVLIDRCLSWGRTNDLWLRNVGAEQPIERIGSPLRDRYTRTDTGPTNLKKSKAETNVMILQYGFNVLDLAGVNANMYGTFVNTVRILRDAGYRNLMLKMHPGPGRWTQAYFERIRETFDLECEIRMQTPFSECLEWADIVIGPSHTGAMFESLAAGKPYHALLLAPHNTFDKTYFNNFKLIEDLNELPNMLENYNAGAGQTVLNELYSVDNIANPSQRFWDVLSGPRPEPGTANMMSKNQ
jgi:hypothetical protein